VIEVGRQRGEPFTGEAPGYVLDVVVEPPPLLDNDDAREGPVAVGASQVTVDVFAVSGKGNHFCLHAILRSRWMMLATG
jgi:hypothetical protein